MKEQILKLRAEGKTYNEIKAITKCSKSTISYHCGEGQKEKNLRRQRKFRRDNVIAKKVDAFKHPNADRTNGLKPESEIKSNVKKRLQDKGDSFQRLRLPKGKAKAGPKTFNYKDVLEHYGEQTTCYLSGRPLNLLEPRTYQFDHKIPASRGGNNSFENLGIASREANIAKSDMTVDELILLCKEILEHNGYAVKRRLGNPMGDGARLESG